jgi:hypothetical protein
MDCHVFDGTWQSLTCFPWASKAIFFNLWPKIISQIWLSLIWKGYNCLFQTKSNRDILHRIISIDFMLVHQWSYCCWKQLMSVWWITLIIW